MYRKLLPLLRRFVFVRQGAFNRYYEGKLIAVDTDSLQIQSFKKDGAEDELWTIALDTISEFSVGGRHLAELELKVSYLSSDDLSTEAEAEIHPEEKVAHQKVESRADEAEG